MPNTNITLVVTSCGRHDLLQRTLRTFLETADLLPQETIIIEDGPTPMPEWMKEQPYRGLFITWIQNEQRMGQIYSIDRAYALVKTDYIFHCEDDWDFVHSEGWMRESKAILDKYPEIIQVSLRGDTGWHRLIDWPPYPFKIAMPGWHGHWGGISFNPGLRRTADYKKIGSYGRHVAYGTHGLGHEAQLSQKMLDLGYRIADLNKIIVVHTGGARSVSIQPLPAMPKILIAIPACHKYDYGKWESAESPHFDQTNAYNGEAYGKDIHISGTNNRIATLRETWLKDIEPFKAHVDYKFFLGKPHPRPALPDEVYLDCPDDYAGLPQKSIAIAKWAYEQGYDFLYKGDDDTGVYVDRLVAELMSSKFDYAGCLHHRVCTGGPGYWLSRRAMKAIINNDKPDHWAEDVSVARILNRADIYPENLPGHKSGAGDHWFFPNGFDPEKFMGDVVTFHAVQPEVMRAWHEHISKGAKK